MKYQIPRAALIAVLALPLVAAKCDIGVRTVKEDEGNKSERERCIATQKRDYPVPPGNINELNRIIDLYCN